MIAYCMRGFGPDARPASGAACCAFNVSERLNMCVGVYVAHSTCAMRIGCGPGAVEAAGDGAGRAAQQVAVVALERALRSGGGTPFRARPGHRACCVPRRCGAESIACVHGALDLVRRVEGAVAAGHHARFFGGVGISRRALLSARFACMQLRALGAYGVVFSA